LSQSPLRFGITGLGMIAEIHAAAITAMADAELVAVHAITSIGSRLARP